MASVRNALGIHEITEKKGNLARALVAEFLGTLLLNFFGCGAAASENLLTVAMSFGLTVAGVIQAIGHVSGGHINPAVTLGLLAVGKVPVIRALLYVVVQCAGAIAGSAVLGALSSDKQAPLQGVLELKNEVTAIQGFGIEFFLAFILVLVVCGACDPGKPESKALAPLVIGLVVTVGHIVGIPRTNTGMNPARALGSAVVKGEFPDHWLYWVGPVLGGVAAALIYHHALGPAKEETEQLPSRAYTTVATEEKEAAFPSMDCTKFVKTHCKSVSTASRTVLDGIL